MPGKTNGLTALELRKQLLVVESELNRAHLAQEMKVAADRIHQLTGQLSALGSVVSAVGQFGPSVAGLFEKFSSSDKNEPGKKSSWFSRLFSGVRAGVDLFSAIRSDRD